MPRRRISSRTSSWMCSVAVAVDAATVDPPDVGAGRLSGAIRVRLSAHGQLRARSDGIPAGAVSGNLSTTGRSDRNVNSDSRTVACGYFLQDGSCGTTKIDRLSTPLW